MSFICAANWKMNLSFQQAQDFLEELQRKVKDLDISTPEKSLRSALCIFPQAVHAPLFQNIQNINWGAQDFYFESSGAFTGQNSPDLFKELGANVMLIGHSERRTLFHESESSILKKIKKCFELSMIPMVCVGETLEQRKMDLTLHVIKEQLESVMIALEESSKASTDVIIAYEPVWAIGTGLVAEATDVQKVHDSIKSLMGSKTKVLYGGSVKPENATELASIPSVNGFLIGGASLKVDSFLGIFKNSK